MGDRLGIIGAIGIFISEDPLILGWSGRSDVHADPAGQDDVPCNLLPHAGPRGGGCKYHPGITTNQSRGLIFLIIFRQLTIKTSSIYC